MIDDFHRAMLEEKMSIDNEIKIFFFFLLAYIFKPKSTNDDIMNGTRNTFPSVNFSMSMKDEQTSFQ